MSGALTKKLAGNVVTVFNGSSFIGQNLLARLGKAGAQVVIAYRGSGYDEGKFRTVGGLGQVYFSHFNLKDEKSLYEAMRYSDVVVNCIGKLNETSNFSFDQVHVEGPRLMAKIAREAGVPKFIHLSSMNVSPDPKPVVLKNGSQFLRSKYFGELAVREEFPDAIIFRPSYVLGRKDSFLNHFTELARCRYSYTLALWDYYDGVVKQPVWVSDIVDGIERAIHDNSANGKTYQAVGPYRYKLEDFILFIREAAGLLEGDGYRVTNMRYDILMRLFTSFCVRYRKYPLITWERIECDSTSDILDPKLPTLVDLGVKLTPLEEHVQVLAKQRPSLHRYEVTYETAQKVDQPRRLNVAY